MVIDTPSIPTSQVAADQPFFSGKCQRHGMNLQDITSPNDDITSPNDDITSPDDDILWADAKGERTHSRRLGGQARTESGSGRSTDRLICTAQRPDVGADLCIATFVDHNDCLRWWRHPACRLIRGDAS